MKEILISKIQSLPTILLCETITKTHGKANESGVPELRELVMDELEQRNPDAFDLWLESDSIDPSTYFKLS